MEAGTATLTISHELLKPDPLALNYWICQAEKQILMGSPWCDQSSHPENIPSYLRSCHQTLLTWVRKESPVCFSTWLRLCVPNIEYFVFYRLSSNLYLLQHTDVIHRHRTSVFPDKHLIYKEDLQQSSAWICQCQKDGLLLFCEKMTGFLISFPKRYSLKYTHRRMPCKNTLIVKAADQQALGAQENFC